MTTWLPLIAGLALLVVGGELLVRGAVQAATRLGVSPLVIGLTLVGFGTSTPELVTSVQASLAGSPGIAYGNIVGSNIANLLLIIGISALFTPLLIASSALRRDAVIMLGVTIGFAALAALTPMTRAIGAAFVLGLAAYIFFVFRQERSGASHGAVYQKSEATQQADPGLTPVAATPDGPSFALALLTVAAGLAIVIAGGHVLVQGAVAVARGFGISETVIGLTIVAVGTSMPELITSIVAAYRKQADVAFGNIIGSNIYNILGIGGATALIAPIGVPAEIIRFDNPVMIGASLLLILFAFTGLRIARWEGALLLAGYCGYVFWIWP